MKISTIIIIILSIIVIILLASIVFTLFFKQAEINALTKKIDENLKIYNKNILAYQEEIKNIDLSIDIRDKRIADLENRTPEIIKEIITKEILKLMPSDNKDKLILNLQTDKDNLKIEIDKLNFLISSDTILIDKLRVDLANCNNDLSHAVSDLEKANSKLKDIWYPHWGISVNESGTLGSGLNLNFTTNLIFKKYFFSGRFYVGGGLSFVVDKEIKNNNTNYGGGFNIELGGNF